MAQETPPVACILDLEGLTLITRGLVALLYLFLLSNLLIVDLLSILEESLAPLF
jgi:hypothetical protein